eukprot:1307362-Amorphochlora_amoeboformis.AAC.1
MPHRCPKGQVKTQNETSPRRSSIFFETEGINLVSFSRSIDSWSAERGTGRSVSIPVRPSPRFARKLETP